MPWTSPVHYIGRLINVRQSVPTQFTDVFENSVHLRWVFLLLVFHLICLRTRDFLMKLCKAPCPLHATDDVKSMLQCRRRKVIVFMDRARFPRGILAAQMFITNCQASALTLLIFRLQCREKCWATAITFHWKWTNKISPSPTMTVIWTRTTATTTWTPFRRHRSYRGPFRVAVTRTQRKLHQIRPSMPTAIWICWAINEHLPKVSQQ